MNTKKINTKTMVILSLMTALEIVLSRFASINTWNMKIGFGFVPIALTAMLYGPVPAGIVAALADFIGALLFPIGAYFPGFTLTAFLNGVVFGVFLYPDQTLKRIIGAVTVQQVFLSLLLNSYWISVAYGTPFTGVLISRLPQVGILFVVEILVISLLAKILPQLRPLVTGTETEQRQRQRSAGIAARNALSDEERAKADKSIVQSILESPEWKAAHTILLYRAVKGEVCLDGLIPAGTSQGKVLAFPKILDDGVMEFYEPLSPDSWTDGRYHILEPNPAASRKIPMSEPDFILCPCTAFDNDCNRFGAGAGYYDRYLSEFDHAEIAAAAYWTQRQSRLAVNAGDVPMKKIFTEKKVLVRPESTSPAKTV